MTIEDLPAAIKEFYEVREWKHAVAVLKGDFPSELADIVEVLDGFRIRKSQILEPGGSRSSISRALDGAFYERGWVEKRWETKVVVDETAIESPTHNVDCFKNGVALEIEWSNKDPFFDRDLNNFRLLFDLRAISVGVIITKSDDFKALFRELGVYSKYGASTTWMTKLLPRVEGGAWHDLRAK